MNLFILLKHCLIMTKKSNITFFSLSLEWNGCCWKEWDLSLTHSAATPDGSTLAQSYNSSHLFLHGAPERVYSYFWWIWVEHHPEAVAYLKETQVPLQEELYWGMVATFFWCFWGTSNSQGGKVLVCTKALCWKSFQASSWAEFINYSNHLPTHMRKIHRSVKFPTWEVEYNK